MNRVLLAAILITLLWCSAELRRMNRVRHQPTSGPWPTTIHYYVPDGTCINISQDELR